jgi:uncharacterized protein YfiM (DUF2279 family)
MMTTILLPLMLIAADTSRVRTTPPVLQPVSFTAAAVQERDAWLGEDKFMHFAMSYVITTGSFGAARVVTDKDASLATGIALGAAAGILKEIYDKRDSRRFSVRDLLWDAAGITAGVLIARQTR